MSQRAYDEEEPTWRNASPESILRDTARLGYWAAVIKSNPKRIAAALKAWSFLLQVKRIRKTK